MLFKAPPFLFQFRWYYLLFVILITATFQMVNHVEKFNISSKNIIDTSNTEKNTINNKLIISENGETLTKITSTNAKSYTGHLYIVKIDSDEKFVNFESDIKSENIKHGELYWEAGRLIVFFLDSNNNIIKGTRHTAKYIYTDFDWFTINHTYIIPTGASYAKAGIEFLNSSGLITIKNTKLRYTKESILYLSSRLLLLSAWLSVIFLFIKASTKNIPTHRKNILILSLFLILAGIILPLDLKLAITNNIFPSQSPYTHIDTNTNSITTMRSPMEIIHFIAFSILALISLSTFSRNFNQSIIIINLFIFSIISEVLQMLSLGRTPKVSDIFIDNYGIVFGFVTYTIYKRIRRKH